MYNIFDFKILSVVIILFLLYKWYSRKFDHWKQKGVPYIEPSLIFGNIKDRLLFKTSFTELQIELYRKFQGHKYAGIYEGQRPSLMIRDPELLKFIMVRDFAHFEDRPSFKFAKKSFIHRSLLNLEGSEWKQVRSILTPTFSTGKLKAMESLVTECGKQLGEFLKSITEETGSTEQEMKHLHSRFTMDVIASCAFGVDVNSYKDMNGNFIQAALKFNDINVVVRIIILVVILFIPNLSRFFPLSFFNNEAMLNLFNIVQESKKHRLNTNERRNDFLQLLLDAQKTENEMVSENESHKGNAVLDEETLGAQAVLFLLAGFETSSTLLSYASYELAINPDIQENVRSEINSVLKKFNGVCDYEALQEMKYTEMVLSETLRKYPPVPRVDRKCTKDYTIPGTDIVIKKSEAVAIPVAGIHHDPEFYPNPEKFDPTRFLPEEKERRSPYIYLPFGAGPRNCIGLRFALMSTKIALMYLLKDFYLKPCNKTEIPLKINRFSVLLKAENGIWITIQRIM